MKETLDTEKGLIGAGCLFAVALLVGAGFVIHSLSSVYSDSHTLSLLQCLPSVPDIADTLSAFRSQTHIVPHFGLGPDPATPLYNTGVPSYVNYITQAENICRDIARDAGWVGVKGVLNKAIGSILTVLR